MPLFKAVELWGTTKVTAASTRDVEIKVGLRDLVSWPPLGTQPVRVKIYKTYSGVLNTPIMIMAIAFYLRLTLSIYLFIMFRDVPLNR
jgi:hypothetical protein